MSRVHSQLSTNEWKGTQLCDIVNDQMKLGPVDEAQISASGPEVYLDATNVPKLAMILHELGTNSLKYGALSETNGKVTIAWTVNELGLEIVWTELGGPAVAVPIGRGFGTRLIESSARGAGGDATMSIEAEGVRWKIVLPHAVDPSPNKRVTDQSAFEPLSPYREPAGSDGQFSSKKLEGKRILVVEDEALLAMDIAQQLEDAGAYVIGPAGNVSEALNLIDHYRFDCALLDANLGGHPVDDIAASLARKKVPFAFVSGYSRVTLPRTFDAVELLSKPFDGNRLLSVVAKLVA